MSTDGALILRVEIDNTIDVVVGLAQTAVDDIALFDANRRHVVVVPARFQ